MRRSKAFTLIEVIVMGSIGLFIAGTVWYMVIAFGRRSQELDHRLQSFQSAQVVLTQIRNDVMRFHPMDQVSMVGDLKRRLYIPVVTDYKYDPDQPAKNHIQVQIVTYEFDASDHRLRRGGEPLRLGQFEEVAFEIVETEGPTGRDEEKPIPDVRNYLKVTLTCVPQEKIGTQDIRDKERITYGAVFPLWPVSFRQAYPLNPGLP